VRSSLDQRGQVEGGVMGLPDAACFAQRRRARGELTEKG